MAEWGMREDERIKKWKKLSFIVKFNIDKTIQHSYTIPESTRENGKQNGRIDMDTAAPTQNAGKKVS